MVFQKATSVTSPTRLDALGMPPVQEDCKTLPKAIIARGRFIEQKLLGLTRKIAPTSNDSETKRIFEVVFVVGIHLLILPRKFICVELS